MTNPAHATTEAGQATGETCAAALAEFLHRFMTAAKTNATDFLAGTDLTFSQLKVLFTVGSHDRALSVNEIAERIHLSLAATGRTSTNSSAPTWSTAARTTPTGASNGSR